MALQLQRPPLESVVAKQSFAVRPDPEAASKTLTSVLVPNAPVAIPEFHSSKVRIFYK